MDELIERVNDIEKRLLKLEKIEQRRKALAIIKFIFYSTNIYYV